MERQLLNAVPDWGIFLILVGGITVIAIVGFILVRRFLPTWRSDASSGVVAAVAAMVMTLFALVLAFSVVDLDQSYQEASSNLTAEANALAEISHDAMAFPNPEQGRIQLAIVAYIHELVNHEFPAMRIGEQDPVASTRINDIFYALQDYSPKTQSQITFYDSAVNDLNTAIADRRIRIGDADSSLPAAFVDLLVLTALFSIATTFFFKTDAPGLEVALVACIAIVIGAGLLTALILQYPFSGSIAVSSDALHQGLLGQLLARYP